MDKKERGSPPTPLPAEEIERVLVHAILHGDVPVGSLLPGVRELAEQYGVNPTTMHRVLARVESRGLVTARPRKGMVVNDPTTVADMALLVEWLRAIEDQPDRAALLLKDVLDLRRMISVQLLVERREAILDALGRLADTTTSMVGADPTDIPALDLALAQATVNASGNVVAAAMLNAFARGVIELPDVLRAFFSDPARNVAVAQEILAALQQGDADIGPRVDAAIRGLDAHTIETYRRNLEARQAPTTSPKPARPSARD